MQEKERYIPPFIRQLMPKASEEEIAAAADNLKSYLKSLHALSQAIELKGIVDDSSTEDPHDRVNNGGVKRPTS